MGWAGEHRPSSGETPKNCWIEWEILGNQEWVEKKKKTKPHNSCWGEEFGINTLGKSGFWSFPPFPCVCLLINCTLNTSCTFIRRKLLELFLSLEYLFLCFFFPFSKKWHVNLSAAFCYKWPGVIWGFKLLWERIEVLHWWTIMGGVGSFLTDCNEIMVFIMYSFVCRIKNDGWISSSWEEGLYSGFKCNLSRQGGVGL